MFAMWKRSRSRPFAVRVVQGEGVSHVVVFDPTAGVVLRSCVPRV